MRNEGAARWAAIGIGAGACCMLPQGSLLGGSRLQSRPCKGRWMRRSAQTEGCIATLRRRYPATPGRALPYASVGDDAGIVPEPCGGGRPQAAGENARPTKPPRVGDDR